MPDIGENPSYGYTSYDNMGLALLTSFQLLTLDFWENTYNMILRASGTWNVIYFILVILLGPFYLLNLLLAVVTMAYSKEHEKQEELREMRKKAKERARNKALRRMKQLEKQNASAGAGSDGEDGRGSNLWAATISSTRIGLGVGISSRSDSGAGSPQVSVSCERRRIRVVQELQQMPSDDGQPSKRETVQESAKSPVQEQPQSSSAASWSASPQDSFDEDESKFDFDSEEECLIVYRWRRQRGNA